MVLSGGAWDGSRRPREAWRFMDPSLILDKLSHGRDGGLARLLGDWEMRASGHLDSPDHGSLYMKYLGR